ncbi:MAG: WD40/YVTN/BNR-like repeat-containing protein [Candidatus Acidiferrales bacterium]
MRWRLIGPFRGGRALAASGVPGKPNEYYFGAVGGGVWKTVNAGQTWQPIFDGQSIASIGALAIAPSQPQTIYVGSGEADMRSDISFGDGVYKSTDGGATWRNIGLRDSQQIGAILVHPHNPNIVLVAALGHAFGPNAERGVYRSTDGGATWEKVLGKDDNTGAIDLCFEPGNPQFVYASLWQTRRPPWSVYAPTNGPGSGLYKSFDGGITWRQITGHGFPDERVGRIGIAIAPGENGRRVYALVDASAGGVYRSDDAGRTWRRVSSDHRIWMRGWYFGGITADPRDPNTVYVANTSLYRSTDGGEHFDAIKGAPGGDDYHLLWIAPDDPQRMILVSDQGTVISVDRGKSWSSWFNQPTAQFYHVTTDNRVPYIVYGSQQDSGTAGVFSRSDFGQITFRDWSPIGGEESGYIALSPADPSLVYGGGPFGMVFRFNWATGQSFDIAPEPRVSAGNRLRYTWTSPLVFSPQDPSELYFGAQYVLRTKDRGQHWETISPDLTLATRPGNSPDAQDEHRGVVYTIAPSPIWAGEIWAGTDNGFIRLTTDDAKSWDDVTPAGLPAWSMLSLIEASHFDAATAYAAVDRHQVDDFHPYIYRTHDAGKTWRNVVVGIPEAAYVHVVREDLERRGLLYAGTELGVFFSFDDGEHWQPLQMNLPVTSIRDIALHGDDLVVGTHGRSFWILDDIEPLREWAEHIDMRNAYLYHPARALRIRNSENHDSPLPIETPVGENPPAGAIIDYYLKKSDAGEVALEIRDKDGRLVRRISSADKPLTLTEPREFPDYWLHVPKILSSAQGMHRYVWDLHYTQPPALRYEYSSAAPISTGTYPVPQGPLVLPGEYEVRLIAGNETLTQKLTVEQDPRAHASPEDLAKQLELEQRIDAALAKNTSAYREIADLRAKLMELDARLFGNPKAKEIRVAVDALDHSAGKIAGREAEYPLLPTGLIELDRTLSSLAATAGAADSAPTAQSSAALDAAQRRLSELLATWETLKKVDLPALNVLLGEAKLAPIVLASSGKPSSE